MVTEMYYYIYTKAEDHMDVTPHKFDGEEITLLKHSHLITMQTFQNGPILVSYICSRFRLNYSLHV